MNWLITGRGVRRGIALEAFRVSMRLVPVRVFRRSFKALSGARCNWKDQSGPSLSAFQLSTTSCLSSHPQIQESIEIAAIQESRCHISEHLCGRCCPENIGSGTQGYSPRTVPSLIRSFLGECTCGGFEHWQILWSKGV
jgi:hypothetical protein